MAGCGPGFPNSTGRFRPAGCLSAVPGDGQSAPGTARPGDVGPDFRLLPGMTVSAEILVGKRRVATYILDPVIRGLHETLNEP